MNISPDSHQLHLYAFPLAARPSAAIDFNGRQLTSLSCHEAAVAASSFPISFEQAFERLQQLDRMFIELDGSFLWTGQAADRNWQIDGMLYDDGQLIKRVEVKGCCPQPAWRQLLSCFDWPTERLLAHWLERNCFVEVTQLIESGLFSPGLHRAP